MPTMTAAQSTLSKHMSEEELTTHWLDRVKDRKLRRFHDYDSRKKTAGLPDEIVTGPRGVVFAEMKTEIGALSPEQREVVASFAAAGITVHVLRPRHLFDGTINELLDAIA